MSPDPAVRFSFSAAPMRVSEPTELVAGLPALFGFRPRHSLFFLALDGPRSRLGFRARADVTGPADIEQAVGPLVLAAMTNRVTSVIVMGHSDDAALAAASVQALADAFEERHVEVVDALRLDDHRFWSLICDKADCCPPEGRAYDTSASRLVAEAVGIGQRIVTDRSELSAEFAEPDLTTARRMSAECDRVRARLVHTHGVDPAEAGATPDLDVLRAGAMAVKELVDRAIRGDPSAIADVDVAQLAIWCRCITVRDVAWSQVDGGDPREHLLLWSAVARRTVAPFEPAVLSLAAFCAWRTGDGARASCALERALRADGNYSMAHLMESVLAGALPPTIWEPVSEVSVWEAAERAQ
jgi:hypothetical protein